MTGETFVMIKSKKPVWNAIIVYDALTIYSLENYCRLRKAYSILTNIGIGDFFFSKGFVTASMYIVSFTIGLKNSRSLEMLTRQVIANDQYLAISGKFVGLFVLKTIS